VEKHGECVEKLRINVGIFPKVTQPKYPIHFGFYSESGTAFPKVVQPKYPIHFGFYSESGTVKYI
jgi:hypothetical protein